MPESDSFYHYLPLSPDQVTWGTYLTGSGRAFVLPNEQYPPQKHPPLYSYDWSKGRTLPDFQILLIQDGTGVFESKESGEIVIDSPVILYLFPDVWHRYRPDPEIGWSERWISFNGELVHRFFKNSHVLPGNPVFTVPGETRLYIEKHFDELLKHIHSRPAENRLLYSFLAMGLIAEAVDATHQMPLHSEGTKSQDGQKEVDSVVTRALEIIWTHSNRPLTIDEIARRLPANRRTLDRHFVEATGHTVLDEINRCRLTRAKRLLRETRLPIKALAHLSGFASQERLRVSFLMSEGMSPSEFRAKYASQEPKPE